MRFLCNPVRFAALPLVGLILAGCVAATPAARPVPVLAGALTVALPRGYCADTPDQAGSQAGRGDTALVIAGRCAGGTTRPAAVLTAAVGAAGTGRGLDLGAGGQGGAALAAWFRSAEGRRALSRRGRAADVTVDQAVLSGGALLLLVTDRAPVRGGPVSAQGWRAVLPLRGRLVTLTVAAPRPAALDVSSGQALIGEFVSRMRWANR